MMPVNMCTGDSEMHNTPPVTAEHVKTSVKSSKPEKTEAHKPEQVKEEKPEKQVNEEEEEETDETMQAASHPESSADSNIVVAEMNAENSGPQKDTKASGANKLTISLATIPLGLTQLFI
jgi:hypothetical protein